MPGTRGTSFGQYQWIYGSLGAFGAFLFMIYVISLIALFGAYFSAAIATWEGKKKVC